MRNTLQFFFLLQIFLNLPACSVQKSNTLTAQKKISSQHPAKKIVFIPGKDSHEIGEHEYLGGCRLLAKLLNENVTGIKAIVTGQGWPKDATILDDADVIVIYCDGGPNHMIIPNLAQMDKLVKKGVGLVVLHYGLEIPKGETGNFFLDWLGGYFETFYSVNPIWTVKLESLPKHPITNGVHSLEVSDEWYYHIRFTKDLNNITPLLSSLPPAATLNGPDGIRSNNEFVRRDVLVEKKAQILAWAYNRQDGGRSVGFTGGHLHNNWMIDDFRKLILNAILWAAKIKVPKKGIITPAPSRDEMNALLKKPAK